MKRLATMTALGALLACFGAFAADPPAAASKDAAKTTTAKKAKVHKKGTKKAPKTPLATEQK